MLGDVVMGNGVSSSRVYEKLINYSCMMFVSGPTFLQHHRYRNNYHRRYHHSAGFQTLIISFFLDSLAKGTTLKKGFICDNVYP